MSNTYGTGADEAPPSSPKEMVTAAAQTVKQEVATFAASAQEKALEKVEQKKETAAQGLGDFASAIRRAGDDLAQNDQTMAGRVVKQAADGLESLTRSLSDKRPEELFDAVRDFGRRNPAAFVAGALLVGLAAGRFLRSSASHADSDANWRPQAPDYDRPAPAWKSAEPAGEANPDADDRVDLRSDITGETAGDIGGSIGERPRIGSEV